MTKLLAMSKTRPIPVYCLGADDTISEIFDSESFSFTLIPEEENEWMLVSKCLKAHDTPEDGPILILKDTTTTILNQKIVTELIQECASLEDYDLCYLSTWQDRCNLHTDAHSLSSIRARVVATQAPQGLQCVLISSEGRKKLLDDKFHTSADLAAAITSEITAGRLEARGVIPAPFHFDITRAETDSDYRKTAVCQSQDNGNGNATGSSGAYIWFVIAVVIVIIIAWALLQL